MAHHSLADRDHVQVPPPNHTHFSGDTVHHTQEGRERGAGPSKRKSRKSKKWKEDTDEDGS